MPCWSVLWMRTKHAALDLQVSGGPFGTEVGMLVVWLCTALITPYLHLPACCIEASCEPCTKAVTFRSSVMEQAPAGHPADLHS